METTIEREVERALARFHKEQQGFAPASCRASILPEMVVVLCAGVFTPTEKELVTTEEGRKIVQSARREQRALTRREAEARVAHAIGRPVLRSFYDLDVRVAEQIEVYLLG